MDDLSPSGRMNNFPNRTNLFSTTTSASGGDLTAIRLQGLFIFDRIEQLQQVDLS